MDFDDESALKDLPIIALDDGFDLQEIIGNNSIDSSIFADIFLCNKDENNHVDNEIRSIIGTTEKTTIDTSENSLASFNVIPTSLAAEYESLARSVLTSSPSTKGTKDFTCSICSKSFPDRRYLNRHFSKHTNRFTCPHCLKSFARKESKLKHIPRCKVINPELRKRKQSQDVSDDTPKYSCDKCFQQFTRKENYDQHIWKHKGIRVMCQNCRRMLSSVKAFSAHKKLHYCTRTLYICNHCASVFLFKSNLKRHLRQCQNVKDIIICNNCNLRVKNQESLNKHMSQSIKKCALCSESFCLENDLRRHRKVFHPELWFKCKLCDPKIYFTARSEHHLQDHAKKAHKLSLTFTNCYEEGWYVRCD